MAELNQEPARQATRDLLKQQLEEITKFALALHSLTLHLYLASSQPMQFFAQGKESLTAQALATTTRSLEMCHHLSTFDPCEHEVYPITVYSVLDLSIMTVRYGGHAWIATHIDTCVMRQAWCQQVLSERATATVGEPESRGTYLKKHTTFAVTLEPEHSCARRRFSDFAWLHDVLQARYVGMLVPSLPEKTVLKTDAFIQSRIRGLAIFLDSVVQSPYLRSDAAVASFFTVTDERDWENAKKETAVMENAGAGHLRWLVSITASSLPLSSECDAYVELGGTVSQSGLVGCRDAHSRVFGWHVGVMVLKTHWRL